MSHAKNPAAQIHPALSLLQMLKQRQENFLNNLLAIMSSQSQRQQIPQHPVPQLIEKPNHFLF
jgi:hypothetical protein